jgi:hypothetical protein
MVANLGQSPQTGEAESEAVCPDFASDDTDMRGLVDPDSVRVIAAWPKLLEDVKATIVTMVEPADKTYGLM